MDDVFKLETYDPNYLGPFVPPLQNVVMQA